MVDLWFCRGECWNDVVWRETWSWLSYGSAGVSAGMTCTVWRETWSWLSYGSAGVSVDPGMTWCGGRHGRGCLMVLQG